MKWHRWVFTARQTGPSISLIRPVKGDWSEDIWEDRRLMLTAGGESQITNMIQSEEIRSVSRRACSGSISTITHPLLICLWFIFSQHAASGEMIWHFFIAKQRAVAVSDYIWQTLFETIQGDSRRAVRSVLLFEEFALCLVCSRCLSQLPGFSTADLPALGRGN